MKRFTAAFAIAFLACSSSPTASSTTTAGSSSASSGAGGAGGAASSASSGQGGAGGARPLDPPDAGRRCVPNGGITQECDPPRADAGKLCPPPCCDGNGCLCFRCRLQTDGIHRCQAFATDAGTCEL